MRIGKAAVLPALMAVALVVGASSPAKAIMITIDSITKNAADTANYSQNNSTNAGEWLSAVSTLSTGANTPDVVNASVQGKTRYAGVLGSDSNALNFGARGDSSTSSYQVVFTVTPSGGSTIYDININTQFLGALVNRDEGGAAGNESITSNVNGTISGASGTGSLSNAIAASQTSQNGTVVTAINKSDNYLITGLTGQQTITLNFSWSQSTSSGNNVLSGGDEAVVIFGLAGTAALIGGADDYPGTANRVQADDGHFVTITATVTSVPEPGTLALAGLGLCGAVLFGRRFRQTA